jgi:polar amino acid transport system permease protein
VNWKVALGLYLPKLAASLVPTAGLILAASLCGLAGGLAMFAGRNSRLLLVRWPFQVLVEAGKGLPALVTMFWLYFCLPQLGLQGISTFWCAVAALALSLAAATSELLRSTWNATAPELNVAASNLGIPRARALMFLSLPNLLVAASPGLVVQLAATARLSSVAAFIGYEEIFHVSQGAISDSLQPIPFYTLLAIVYVLISLGFLAIERILIRVSS